MTEDAQEAEQALKKFSAELSSLQEHIDPLVDSLKTLNAGDVSTSDPADAVSRARLHVLLSYTINSLFCMYLRTQGVDPTTHPIAESVTRTQDAFLRLRQFVAGVFREHRRPKRNVKEAEAKARIAQEALAQVIFPAEADLVRALQNQPSKKRKLLDDDSDGEVEPTAPDNSQKDADPSQLNGHDASEKDAGMPTLDKEESKGKKSKRSEKRKRLANDSDDNAKPSEPDDILKDDETGHLNDHDDLKTDTATPTSDKKKKKKRKKRKKTEQTECAPDEEEKVQKAKKDKKKKKKSKEVS